MSILDKAIVPNHETERISVFNGAATLDFNGAEKERREAMRLYEQAPAAFRLLRRLSGGACNCTLGADETLCERCEAEKVLRDAGVLDE